MKPAIPLSAGIVAGLAVLAAKQRRRVKAEQERAVLEAELLAGLDDVETEIARLNAEFAALL